MGNFLGLAVYTSYILDTVKAQLESYVKVYLLQIQLEMTRIWSRESMHVPLEPPSTLIDLNHEPL